jgi:hypothetical protein
MKPVQTYSRQQMPYQVDDQVYGPIAIAASSGLPDRLFYVGIDHTLYSPSWVDADRETAITGSNCGNEWHNFKTRSPISQGTELSDAGGKVSVKVSPDPSSSGFTLSLDYVSPYTDLDLSIETIDGTVVYHSSARVPDSSGRYDIVWPAAAVAPGLYLYRLRTDSGQLYCGKMVKL